MYSVVVVDDEPWTLIGISNAFLWNENGFELVYKTINPFEAIDYIQKNKPDVVFTDIRMPQVSGIELIKTIKQEDNNVEFIVISGFAEFEYAQDALKQGVFDYCLKPIEDDKTNELLVRLKEHLDKKNNITDVIGYTGMNYEFKQIVDYINKNYMKKLQLKTIADQLFMNHSYCSQLFKKELNTTFSQYLMEVRMKEIKKLLGDVSFTTQEIAEKVGYDDYYYFNKVFKKYFGQTPYKYRKKNLK